MHVDSHRPGDLRYRYSAQEPAFYDVLVHHTLFCIASCASKEHDIAMLAGYGATEMVGSSFLLMKLVSLMRIGLLSVMWE